MEENRQRTILLVEDQAIVAMNEKLLLERHGYAVVTAGTGEKALEIALGNSEIDLILMDIDLGPGIDGTDAARTILDARDMPIVFLSAHTEQRVVEKTEEITSYGYIVKNSGDTILLASLKMAFRLWESERRFQTAFENVSVGMVLTSLSGELLRANAGFAAIVGRSRQELLKVNFADLTHPEDVDESLRNMKAMLAGLTDRCRFSKRFIHRDGHAVWTDVSAILLRNSLGQPLHFVTHVQDTTAERLTREELERQKRQRDLLLESAPVSILVIQDGAYVFANPYAARHLGYESPQEILGTPAINTIAEESRGLVERRMRAIEAGSGSQAAEMVLLRKDGSTVWSESASIPIVYNDRPGALIIGRDLTEQKQTAERLKAAESLAHVGHYDIDLQSGRAIWSAETYRIFGLDPARFEPTMENYASVIYEEDVGAVYAGVEECVRENIDFDMVYRIRHASGSRRFVHSIGRPRVGADGTVVGLLGTIQDVTERRIAESALVESRNRLESVLSATPTGIGVVQGDDRRILEANEKLCTMTGYSREQLLGRSARVLYPTREEYDFVGSEKYRQIAETGTGSVETRWKRKDGSIIDVLLASTPIDPGEISAGVTFTAMDITERKRADERIKQLVREKETLLKEVQHRVKNSMNTMVSLLSLQANTIDSPEALDALNDARSRFRTLAVLYDQLYRTEAHDSGSMREYLTNLVRTITALFPTGGTVTVATEIEDVLLDGKRLSTLGLITNELVTNAMKHAFSNRDDGHLLVRGRGDGQRMTLVVKDNGPGFPESAEAGTQSGFGMTMVKALSGQLGGTIWFEQNDGVAAIVEFSLR